MMTPEDFQRAKELAEQLKADPTERTKVSEEFIDRTLYNKAFDIVMEEHRLKERAIYDGLSFWGKTKHNKDLIFSLLFFFSIFAIPLGVSYWYTYR